MENDTLSLSILIAIGIVAGGGAYHVARSRRHALSLLPMRRTGLEPVDLLAALALMLLAQLLAGNVVAIIDASTFADKAVRQAASVLAGQLLVHGFVAAYILTRIHLAGHHSLRAIGLWPVMAGRDALVLLGTMVLGFATVLGAMNLAAVVGELLRGKPMEPIAHELLTMMRDSHSPIAVGMLYVSAIVLAPLFEEIIFRGLLQNVFVQMLGASQRWPAIVITSLLFAGIHIGAVDLPEALVGLFILSLFFGWLYERTGRLWLAIVMHAAFNGLNVLMARFVAG